MVWIATAYLAPATETSKLESFYRLVRPAGPGWKAVRERTGLPPSSDSLAMSLLGWVLGCAFVYAARLGREDLVALRLRETADSLCGGSLTPLLTHLVSGARLSARELRDLRRLVDSLGERR